MPDSNQILQQSISFHQSGDLDAAEHGYRSILSAEPGHPQALHYLGLVAYQRGDYSSAIKLIKDSIKHMPSDSSFYTNLGNVLNAANLPDEAIEILQQGLAINSSMPLAYNNLGNSYRLKNLQAEAINAYQAAITLDPTFADAYANLGSLFFRMDRLDDARSCFIKTVELNPAHSSAKHMLASLDGKLTEAAPIEHVSQLFDEYSSNFDKHLVEDLGYTMPGLIRQEMDTLITTGKTFDYVIDLGCGTGLAGSEFKNISRHITGIDASRRMIEEARKRNVYDTLWSGSIEAYLHTCNRQYDLFLCADVFPYIGNLEPVFTAVRNCAAEDAYFAFSTELSDKPDYTLRQTGRYAHSRSYLEKTASDCGFKIAVSRTEKLRKHRDEWILGDLIILRSIGH